MRKGIHVGQCLYVQNVRQNSTEQSAFSVKNWTLLQDADKLMSFIAGNYPELYKYVAAKK